MMVPSAAPMILLYAMVSRKQAERDAPALPTGVFALGYLVIWGVFSIAAATLQWGLEQALLISPMMASASLAFGGIVLVAAGLYQLTPLKYACLEHCRSPLHFLTHGFRKGAWGAFRMGAEHGVYCLGCCWVLMALLFVGGVMNLLWIAGIAIFVLIEKLLPFGHHTSRVTGVLLTAWGIWVLAQG
jgi:predicted metal-binding membrane protein